MAQLADAHLDLRGDRRDDGRARAALLLDLLVRRPDVPLDRTLQAQVGRKDRDVQKEGLLVSALHSPFLPGWGRTR